jgi:DNA primase
MEDRKIEVVSLFSSLQLTWGDVLSRLDIKFKINTKGKYRCLCPFHSERHPSFVCFPDSFNYVCQGCGTRGDVVDLLDHLVGVGAVLNYEEIINFLKIGGRLPTQGQGDLFDHSK